MMSYSMSAAGASPCRDFPKLDPTRRLVLAAVPYSGLHCDRSGAGRLIVSSKSTNQVTFCRFGNRPPSRSFSQEPAPPARGHPPAVWPELGGQRPCLQTLPARPGPPRCQEVRNNGGAGAAAGPPSALGTQSLWSSAVASLKGANSLLPQTIVISTLLALAHPPSFTWFTTRYYAPALGFLMFAVGLNLSPHDFRIALQRPGIVVVGFVGQFGIKPLLGWALAHTLTPLLGLPEGIASGLILVSCVSGAQLSNYATFLVDARMAPLSIVMTALSTATATFITPLLTLLLLGQRLPVDLKGMMMNIVQIVVVPIAAGLTLNRFAPSTSSAIRPFLPQLSVLTTALCIGSPLAINASSLRSPFGVRILLPVVALHTAAFVVGYYIAARLFRKESDARSVARTVSFETGMQSSLLGLALANRFFVDPMVALPCAISVIIMSLMGFGLVTWWRRNGDGKES